VSDIEQCKRHGLPADWCGPCAAALEERERIIALLESSYPRLKGAAEWAIALIKGENK